MDYIKDSLDKLREYCIRESHQGWDPYDGLNSRVFQNLPLKYCRFSCLFWIQLFKNSPLNLRKIFFVPKDYNPKGLGLFISGYVNLYKAYGRSIDKDQAVALAKILLSLESKGYKGACWGYNFDWQSRAFFIPCFSPNVVVSTFCANALLDLYEISGDKIYLNTAISVADFILQDLNRSQGKVTDFCFSYSPLDRAQIFNASLLASKFLARLHSLIKQDYLKEEAKAAVEFCAQNQNPDGSWFYGTADNQKWIDSFHTGYNLEALYDYHKYTGDSSYAASFNRGLNYYLENFFAKDGTPKYFYNSPYPIDIHSPAQLVVLLAKCGLLKEHTGLLDQVLGWTIKQMQDKGGFFYYQKKKYYTIKIPYIRWSQAWMFYALSLYLREARDKGES